MYENNLYHHGVIGMKWGVRRYQNADGSLTSKGKKHYVMKGLEEDTYNVTKNKSKNYLDKLSENRKERTKAELAGMVISGVLIAHGLDTIGGLTSTLAYSRGHFAAGYLIDKGTSITEAVVVGGVIREIVADQYTKKKNHSDT